LGASGEAKKPSTTERTGNLTEPPIAAALKPRMLATMAESVNPRVRDAVQDQTLAGNRKAKAMSRRLAAGAVP